MSKVPKPHPHKVTRYELDVAQEKEKKKKEKEQKKKERQEKEEEESIPVNINHVLREERERALEEGIEYAEGRSLDEALEALSVSQTSSTKPDRHPEKRVKAAYLTWEEARLPSLKEENPTLKHSQLKELLWKEWQKSPENPLNQQRQ